VLMGGSGLLGRPCCWPGASPLPGGAYVYEGGRPSWLLGFMVFVGGAWGGWGRLVLLALVVTCGESEVGRWVGVLPPEGEGDGLLDELLRFEPTRFLKRAFMEFIRTRKRRVGGRVGWTWVKCEQLGLRGHKADGQQLQLVL